MRSESVTSVESENSFSGVRLKLSKSDKINPQRRKNSRPHEKVAPSISQLSDVTLRSTTSHNRYLSFSTQHLLIYNTDFSNKNNLTVNKLKASLLNLHLQFDRCDFAPTSATTKHAI